MMAVICRALSTMTVGRGPRRFSEKLPGKGHRGSMSIFMAEAVCWFRPDGSRSDPAAGDLIAPVIPAAGTLATRRWSQEQEGGG